MLPALYICRSYCALKPGPQVRVLSVLLSSKDQFYQLSIIGERLEQVICTLYMRRRPVRCKLHAVVRRQDDVKKRVSTFML